MSARMALNSVLTINGNMSNAHHWTCFHDWALRCEDDQNLAVNKKWSIIETTLREECRGICVFNNKWLDYLEFDTEEDLLYFKLKFN